MYIYYSILNRPTCGRAFHHKENTKAHNPTIPKGQLTHPCRCGHHPRLRPRRISPAARLPSNRGLGGIPRSLSVLCRRACSAVLPASVLLLDGPLRGLRRAVQRSGLLPRPPFSRFAHTALIQRLANQVRNRPSCKSCPQPQPIPRCRQHRDPNCRPHSNQNFN